MTVLATKVEIDMAASSDNPFNRFKTFNQGGTKTAQDYIAQP
jgi:hypothetical protein